MAGHAASVGNDGNCFLHSRYPVRRGHHGYEDFAFLEFVDVFRISDDVAFAGSHSRGSRKTFNEYLMISCHFHFSACLLFFISLGPNGFRTSLQDPDAVLMIYSPFHIHVAAIVFFNGFSVFSKGYDLFIGQSLGFCQVFRNGSFFYVPAFFADEFNGFFIDLTALNGKVVFVDDEVIRGNCALYDVFAEAPGSFDHDGAVVAVCDVDGEHNACDFGVSHHLDSCGKSHVFMVEILLGSVVYSAVSEGGSIAFLDLADDHIASGNVEVGVLLACEGSVRQIFSGSGRTDSHIRIFFIDLLCEFFVCITDSLCQVFRHFCRSDAFADLCADFMEFHGVFYIGQVFKQFMDLLVLSCCFHEISVSMSCRSVSIRYRHARGSRQFAQGRRFPANQCDIFSVQFVKP